MSPVVPFNPMNAAAPSNMIYSHSIRIYILTLVVTLLAGCAPAGPLGPPGRVTLSYLGDSGSEFRFVLENRSAQEIVLPVSKWFWVVKPWHSTLGCTADDSSYVVSIWPSVFSNEGREFTKVPPEGRLQLRVEKGDFAMPRFRRGQCDVGVLVENHAVVELKNFKR